MIYVPERAALGVVGNVDLHVIDAATQCVIGVRHEHNRVPVGGRNILRDLLARGVPGSGTGFAPTHIAFGSGTTAASDTDTKLVTENFRAEIDSRFPAASQITFQIFLDSTTANGLTLSEAALFDNAGSPDVGNMLGRVTFTPISKSAAVEVSLTWDIIITSV